MANPNDEIPSTSELKELVTRRYYLEYKAIENTKFPSTSDRLMTLQFTKEACDNGIQLLDEEEEDEKSSDDDMYTLEQKRAIEEVWKYVRASIWASANAIHNMKMRSEYIEKVKVQAEARLEEIKAPGVTTAEVELIARQAVRNRNAIMEATRAKLSKSSEAFSKYMKERGKTFTELIDTYKNRHEDFQGTPFEELAEDEQLLVYSDIVEASGRSSTLVNLVSKVQGTLAIAQLLVLVGITVWDIATSSEPVVTAARDVWVMQGALGGGFVADTLVTSAVSAGLVAAGVELSTACGVAFMAGLLSGFVVAAAAAVVYGSVFNLILKCFRLTIPPELKTSIITVLYVPLDSPLTTALTSAN